MLYFLIDSCCYFNNKHHGYFYLLRRKICEVKQLKVSEIWR